MRLTTVIIIILRNIELSLRDFFSLNLRPYKVLLELTDYCNSKCKTCFIWKNADEKKNQIIVSELEPLLKEYGSNLLWLSLGGGEVTLYQDFDVLIDAIARNCSNLRIVTFTTNALKPEKVLECSKKIRSYGYDLFVTVSLDGDQKTHDDVRGVKGNYFLAQQTMQLLKKNRIWAHFGLTVSRLNSDYISNFLKNDIEQIRAFSFEHTGGIYKTDLKIDMPAISKNIKKIRSLYKIRQLAEIVEFIYISLAQKFFDSKIKTVPIPCEVIATSLHIRPNGDIKPCMYLPRVGNIKHDQLGPLLKTTATRQLRARALSAQCEKCWMNCYAPHSIMRHPLLAFKMLFLSK